MRSGGSILLATGLAACLLTAATALLPSACAQHEQTDNQPDDQPAAVELADADRAVAQAAAAHLRDNASGDRRPVVSRPDPVADIGAFVDPAGDDWPSETQAEDARRQLAALGAVLEATRTVPAGAEPLYFDRCLLPPLRPGPRTASRVGAMRIERFRAQPEAVGRTPPARAFEDLLAPHAGGEGLRFEFKVVGVISHSDDDFATDVVFHAFSAAPDGRRVQQNARWLVSWVRDDEQRQDAETLKRQNAETPKRQDAGTPIHESVETAKSRNVETAEDSAGRHLAGELARRPAEDATTGPNIDRAPPRIVSILVMQYDEISADGPAFVDCTRGVIRDDALWHPQLALGCDWWFGRVDGVGEMSFMGHNGIAVGDVNGDGLEDLYVAMGTGLPNKLLVQQADGSVRDMAAEAGVDWLDDTKGVLLIDWDNDGDADLVCAIGPTLVFHENDGRGRFTVKFTARAANPAPFYSLAAADYDMDGDLDIYACRYVEVRYGVSVPVPFQDATNGPPNVLLRNDGERGFTDVTAAVGLDVNNNRFSTAIGWADYDDDGAPDLYVANDFGRNNLYRNDGGRFVDVAAHASAEDQAAGMGVSWADFDGDGRLDLYVSNMFSGAGHRIAFQPRFLAESDAPTRHGVQRHVQGNTLLVNQGKGLFLDRSDEAGVRMGRWAWGAKFLDVNNNGWPDLLVPNGFLTGALKDDLCSFFWRRVASQESANRPGRPPQRAGGDADRYLRGWSDMNRLMLAGYSWSGRERKCCFVNMGDGTFTDVSALAGVDTFEDARAMATVDWDCDGHVDVWMRNRSSPQLRFWRNAGGSAKSGDANAAGEAGEAGGQARLAGRAVSVRLIGRTCNRDAVGAKLSARVGERMLVRVIAAGDGYMSQSSLWAHFGLGDSRQIDELTIDWPVAHPRTGADDVAATQPAAGGRDVYRNLAADGRYEIVQGGAEPKRLPARMGVSVPATGAVEAAPPSSARIVLQSPLPLPPSLRSALGAAGDAGGTAPTGNDGETAAAARGPTLVCLWAGWCRPCIAELAGLAAAGATFVEARLGVTALNVDDATGRQAARRLFTERLAAVWNAAGLATAEAAPETVDALDAVFKHIRLKEGLDSLPMSLMIDAAGRVQVAYVGPVEAKAAAADARDYGRGDRPEHLRFNSPGRWCFRVPRSYADLASDLDCRGHKDEAAFYRRLQDEAKRE